LFLKANPELPLTPLPRAMEIAVGLAVHDFTAAFRP
jgi:hypothetical protein